MMQKSTYTKFILTIAVVAAAMGIAAEAQAPGEGAIRATIVLPDHLQEWSRAEEVDACRDLHERVTIALTAPSGLSFAEYQAAYERVKEKARPSIPVDERVLTLFAKNEAGRICDAGCGVVEFSANCRRSALQTMEDCVQQGNILACEVRYDCSVSCAPLPPEPVSLPVEPEEPSWFAPLSNVFERFTEPEKEERTDEIIPAPLEGASSGGEGGGNVETGTPALEVPEASAETTKEPAQSEEEKQRHAVPEEELLLPPPEPKEERLMQPPPEVKGIPSVPLEYEEWKQRWDEYWERWGRGEENLGPPPELPPWQENIHSEQPPECTVCAQYWSENPTAGSTTKTPACTVCEQYWQNLYSH